MARPSTCIGSPSSARPACWRCSPTAPTPTSPASPDRNATSSTASRRSSAAHPGKIVVAAFSSSIYRMRLLVDLAASSSSARSPSSAAACSAILRSPCASAYLRMPAGLQIRDSDVADLPPTTSSACARARRASRWPPCPESPSTTTGTSRSGPDDDGRVLGPGHPGQRKGHRPGDEPPRPARRHIITDDREARPRLRPRQRRGTETGAVAGAAALFRADTRGVPATGPPCPHGAAGAPTPRF
jgi:hypothetical protein